ncbi:MAG: carbohydrate kinase family protein [Oscillospiraceae bacterium]|nr:carbohydrate kinase family protein [Oscillospiraceae bacterium]
MRDGKQGGLYVVGDVCVDVLIPVSGLLAANEAQLRRSLDFRINAGGTCGNTVAALARLGLHPVFLGSVGADFGGRFIRQELSAMGVDMDSAIVEPERNTINVFAFINEDGERNLWAFPTVDPAYTQLDLSRVDLAKVCGGCWLHSSGMNYALDGQMREALPRLFKAAYERGVPTSFDLNTRMGRPEDLDPGVRAAVLETLPYVRYLLGSAKDEFYSFCPRPDWRDSARSFVTDARTVIARTGKDGAFVVSREGEFELRPYSVTVKDTVGAGDAFNAGFICAMVLGKSLREAVDCGNAVASYKVSGSGRHTPTASELEAFMRTHDRA